MRHAPRSAQARPAPRPDALLAWYDRHRRRLPWRARPGETADPYRVWLSEIMLQQTTVAAAGGHFAEFTRRWPDVSALAAATQDEVLAAWAGLGYYARARNLHACARIVAGELDGRFPDTEEGLRKLPGIGPYTAGAVAAIAFDRPAAAVDGNVERVVCRLFAVDAPMPQAKPAIRERTLELVPAARPGDFAQAMMDLGATICTPKRPACALCPWEDACAARAAGAQEDYPVKAAKAQRPTRRASAFYAERADGAVLLARRPDEGLLGGMTALPATPLTADLDPACVMDFAPVDADWRLLSGEVAHVFTHFRLRLTVHAATRLAGPAPAGMRWVAREDLPAAGLPTAMRKGLQHALEALHGKDAARAVAVRRPARP